MLLLILILPLLGFLGGSLFGKHLGIGVCYITCFNLFLTFFLSVLLFINILTSGVSYKISLIQWIFIDSLHVNWSFCFDSLTVVLLLVVTLISTLVHVYSTEYMENDPHITRFMAYLSLFTFFMLVLITSNNFLQMFMGWEGVGLSSYLLINFWFTRVQANKAAIKAMLVNKIGDFFMLLALFTLYFTCNTLDYDVVFALAPVIREYKIIFFSSPIFVLDLICGFILLGAMGKSAQLGLHTWLPDAMEGPTPVSALIHAATMVTAGIFLIIRCSFLFEFSPLILNIIVIIGSFTAFFAATIGLFQNDIKRIIAYSTCSQLGYMMFACGLSGYEIGLFHLSNHAFFKALLFLGAGSVIHAIADEQDIRKMGGLREILPFSYSVMLIASLALIGFPFLSGFYSKDVILEIAYAKFSFTGHLAYFLGTIAAFCTSFYSTRLIFLVFLSETNGTKGHIIKAHEASYRIVIPLFILCCLSVFVGFISKDLLIGFGTSFWNNAIFILPSNYMLTDIEFLDFFYKILPTFLTLLNVFFIFYIYNEKNKIFFVLNFFLPLKKMYSFLNKKWYVDKLYNQLITQHILQLGYTYTYRDFDRGLLEKVGPVGLVASISGTVKKVKLLQSGFIFFYLYAFALSFVLFVCLIVNLPYIFFNINFILFLTVFFLVTDSIGEI